jgi:hypothetical protein
MMIAPIAPAAAAPNVSPPSRSFVPFLIYDLVPLPKAEKARQPLQLPRLRAFLSCLKTHPLLAERIKPHINCGQTAQGPLCIHLGEPRPFSGQVVFRENRFDRTLGHTRVTIDAGFRIDYQHVIVKMKSFYRTGNRAISIAAVNTRFGNHVSHPKNPPRAMQLLHG